MGWEEIDKKYKRHVDKQFVSCTEKYEMDYVKKVLKEHYPHKSDAAIEAAIKACCEQIPPPRSREKFMQCLAKRLG